MSERRDERRQATISPCWPSCALGDCLVRRHVEGLFDAPLVAGFKMVTAPRGHRLELAGSSAPDLSIVIDGMVMLESYLPDGRRQVIGFCTAGDILAPMAHCETLAYDVAVIARTRLCQLRLGDGLSGGWLRERQAKALFDTACARLASAERHLLLLARLTAREKVASFLLEMAARIGRPSSSGQRLELPMNREVIADYLGLNAETVSRQFSCLKRFGTIDLPRPGLVLIADPERLADETSLARFKVARLSAALTAEPYGRPNHAPTQAALR